MLCPNCSSDDNELEFADNARTFWHCYSCKKTFSKRVQEPRGVVITADGERHAVDEWPVR